MAEEKNKRGIVYVITNPSIPGKVNIGHVKSKPDDPFAVVALKRRIQQHSSGSVPEPYKLQYAVAVDDALKAEGLLHRAFGFVRPNRREFFDVDADKVEAAMRLTLIDGSDHPTADTLQKFVAPAKKNKAHAPQIRTSGRSAQEKKKIAAMSTMQLGRRWLLEHYPNEANKRFRPSKFYEKQNRWWFTFSCEFFRKRGHLNILLQKRDAPEDFYFLRVPFTFFRDHQDGLDIRRSRKKFDLHLSAADGDRWLKEERRGMVSFAQFVQNK